MKRKLPLGIRNIFPKELQQLFLGITILLTGQLIYSQGAACAGAVNLTVNGASVSGTITDTNVTPAPTSCVLTLTSDGWYKFTATATTHYVSISASSRNLILYAYSSCGGAQINCANNITANGAQTETMTLTGLSIGSVYFIRAANSAANTNMPLNSVIVSTTPQYCVPSFNTLVEAITNVTFAGINNSNAGTAQYQNFTAISGNVVQGSSTNAISISGNTEGNFTDYIRVYIDWNRDGNFTEGADERYNIGTITNCQGCAVTANITVPATAALGSTRMRVVKNWDSYSTACAAGDYGQAEDYTINVTAPGPAVTSFTPTSICSAANDEGRTVVITGTLFSGATAVSFNGVAAQSFVVNSATQITAIAPASVTTGLISVTGPTGTGNSASSFTVNPNPTVGAIVNNNGPLCVGDTVDLDNPTPTGLWSSSNQGVATVDGDGIVTAMSAGNANIIYSVTNNGCTTNVSTLVTVNAPITSTDPSPQTVVTGTNAVFSVTANGSILSYQWQVSTDGGDTYSPLSDDTVYSGTATNTLTITATPGSLNDNQYSVLITAADPCPTYETAGALLIVGDTGIASDPSNVELCDSGNATFTVVASGTVDSYQWEENQGLGFMTITDGTVGGLTYSGSQTDQLTVSGATTANSGWVYRAVVIGPANSPTSNAATLTVNEGLSIDSNPSNAISCVGIDSSTFTVSASGAVASYQWQYSTDGISYSNVTGNIPGGATYSGASASSLTVNTTGTTPVGTYYYKAIVNATAPCPSTESAAAILTISQPAISVTPPTAAYCNPGAAVSLTASGAVSYTWSPAQGLSATTGATVTASPAANTTYTVTGTDANGCVNSTTVAVTVGNGVSAAAAASSSVVCPGQNVQLSATGAQEFTTSVVNQYIFAASSRPYTEVSGSATPLTSVQDDDVISAVQNIGFTFPYGGSTFTQFRMSSNGFISLSASASDNSTNNLQPANAGLRPIIAPLWDDMDGTETGYAAYEVTGVAPARVLTVEWRNWEWDYTADISVISFQAKLYETSGIVEFCYRSEGGAYVNGFTGGASIGINAPTGNGVGSYLSVTSISSPTAVSTSSTNNLNTKPATGTLYRFTPGNAPTFTYQWTSTPAGFTSSIANPTATPSVNTVYHVTVTSPSGCSGTASVPVNIDSGATITTEPAPLTVCQGNFASLSVTASGPGLSYQWFRNGIAVSGNPTATTATLSVSNATPAMSGNYYVVVSAACGPAATSNTVALLVNPTPTATATSNSPVCVGYSLNLTGTSNGTSFSWTGPNGFNSTEQNPVISNVTAANAGTYSFTSFANGCPSAVSSIVVSVSTIPAAPTTTGYTICQGASVPAGQGLVSSSATFTGSQTLLFNITGQPVESNSAPGSLLASATMAALPAGATVTSIMLNGNGITALGDSWQADIRLGLSGAIVNAAAAGAGATNGPGTFNFTRTASTGITANISGGNVNILYWDNVSDNAGTEATFPTGYTASLVINYSYPGTIRWYADANGGSSIGTGSPFNPVGTASLPNSNTPGTYTFYAEMNSNCPSATRTPANFVINPTLTASVSISTAATTVCAGSNVTFNATPSNGGTSPSYVWKLNGSTIPGATGNSYSTSTLANNDVITVEMTSNATPCLAGSPATSNAIQMTVNPNVTYYADADNDGFGNPLQSQISCFGAPEGYVIDNTDCDDNNAAAHTTFSFYADSDGDTYGTGDLISGVCAEDGQSPPTGYSVNNTDCNDANPGIYQSGTLYVDADNDAYTNGATSIVCYGSALPAGYVASLTAIDCNDSVAAINPGMNEVLYNGIDDNCDGELDEGSQITTQVTASQCGTTVNSINSLISAVSKPNATGYRFEVTDTNTNLVQVIDRPVQYFSMNMLASYEYATTYSIRVELQRNNVWLGYFGPSCLVSTPAVTAPGGAAQVSQSQCGSTLTSINTLIATTSLQNVTGYRFRITNVTDPSAPNQVQTIDRALHWFNLPMLATYNYGTTYLIEVAVKTTGAYSNFGNPCAITSPLVPSITNCGTTIALPTTHIQTASLAKVTSYRFEITNLVTNLVTTIDRPQHWFTFNMVPGYSPGTLYGVRVAVMTSGVYSLYGDACEITSPGTARPESPKDDIPVATAFSATAYPNPFVEYFMIDVKSSSNDEIEIKVFDMTGRLLEIKNDVDTAHAPRIGENYPAGVYNIIVSQGTEVKTLRVIKR